jgi:hypothetical protein
MDRHKAGAQADERRGQDQAPVMLLGETVENLKHWPAANLFLLQATL